MDFKGILDAKKKQNPIQFLEDSGGNLSVDCVLDNVWNYINLGHFLSDPF